MSHFSTLTAMNRDPIYGLQLVFKKDPRPHKVNLSIGVCQDEGGKVRRFRAVEQAEARINQGTPDKAYLPIDGLPSFCTHVVQKLGAPWMRQHEDRVYVAQTLGGTGALHLAAHLLLRSGIREMAVPSPTWVNHASMFQAAGLHVTTYPYYDAKRGTVAFAALSERLERLPKKSAILLQTSCHNPSGVDPTAEQWAELSVRLKRYGLFPLFDCAYQGLGNGVEEDIAAISPFLEEGHELMVACAYSKNFGLYNERVGALMHVSSAEMREACASHVRAIARATYSSPPAHGARIVDMVLQDATLFHLWQEELAVIRKRLRVSKELFARAMKRHAPWLAVDGCLACTGLFFLLDLPAQAILHLQEAHGVYLAPDGRVNLAAISEENVEQVARALATVSESGVP